MSIFNYELIYLHTYFYINKLHVNTDLWKTMGSSVNAVNSEVNHEKFEVLVKNAKDF